MKTRKSGIFDVQDLDLPDFSSGGAKSQEAHRVKLVQAEIEKLKAIISEKENDIIALQNQVEEVKESSYKNGFNEGYEKSKQDLSESFEMNFSEKITTYSTQIDSVISDLVQAKKGVVLESEKSIIELVFAIVRKITHNEIATNSAMIVDVIKDALPAVDSALTLEIIAHPNDVAVLKEFEDLWMPLTMKRDSISYIEKETVKQGGLVVSTNLGTVDAQIDKVIENIELSIKDQQKMVSATE